MCGRYTAPDTAAILRGFAIGREQTSGGQDTMFVRNADTRPTQRVPVILMDAEDRHCLMAARWGLVPVWWKQAQPPKLAFNARIEGIADKLMWRDAWKHRRCLIPAEGWYEWRDEGGPRKTRYAVQRDAGQGSLIAFAGLWSPRAERDDATVSATIITRPAAPSLGWLHPRMPWVLPEAGWTAWLGEGDPAAVSEQCVEAFTAAAV